MQCKQEKQPKSRIFSLPGLLGFTEAAGSLSNFCQGLSGKHLTQGMTQCQLWVETVTDSFLTSISLSKGQVEA